MKTIIMTHSQSVDIQYTKRISKELPNAYIEYAYCHSFLDGGTLCNPNGTATSKLNEWGGKYFPRASLLFAPDIQDARKPIAATPACIGAYNIPVGKNS
jgi:hypothetical protein